MKRRLSEILRWSALALASLLFLLWLVPNIIVCLSVSRRVLDPAESGSLDGQYDCILVLGAGVKANGEPSDMLADRLEVGCELYFAGLSESMLMSGDHRSDDYDEVGCMQRVALGEGVREEDILLDHRGLSTYESVYRAAKNYGMKKVLIVSQRYHLYRAVFLARAFGLDAVGVSADIRTYRLQPVYNIRESLARVKDFGLALIKPDVALQSED